MSTVSPLVFVSQQVNIYLFIPILIFGVLGGICNLIVFLSLRTFRESSCAFYLTVMSFSNIGCLLTGLLYRIMLVGFGIDWTLISLFNCKLKVFFIEQCLLTSFTCMCLAAIDQFLATSSRPRLQQWSNIKVAHGLVSFFICLWLVHGIPVLIFFDYVVSPTTGQITCSVPNYIFLQYELYVFVDILCAILPISITTLFGCLAYHNLQQMAHRTVPIVRRELDKQLTKIVLIQIVYNLFATLPNHIIRYLRYNENLLSNPITDANTQFAHTVTLGLYYLTFACPFYMYMCISERFRRQFIHVMSKILFTKWRRPERAVHPVG